MRRLLSHRPSHRSAIHCMAASYLPYLPDQDFLLPPSMSEWLPDGHLADARKPELDLPAEIARREQRLAAGGCDASRSDVAESGRLLWGRTSPGLSVSLRVPRHAKSARASSLCARQGASTWW
jgi:hypothetical protein